MGAPVLFNELKKKQRRCEALPSILPFSATSLIISIISTVVSLKQSTYVRFYDQMPLNGHIIEGSNIIFHSLTFARSREKC